MYSLADFLKIFILFFFWLNEVRTTFSIFHDFP